MDKVEMVRGECEWTVQIIDLYRDIDTLVHISQNSQAPVEKNSLLDPAQCGRRGHFVEQWECGKGAWL